MTNQVMCAGRLIRRNAMTQIRHIHEAVHTYRSLRNVVPVPSCRPAISFTPAIHTMSTSLQMSTTNPNFQLILDKALEEYKKKTKKDLITHPLAEEIRACDSPEAILAVLQGKANDLNRSQSSDERLTKWLTPTVNVLNALSATLGVGLGTVSSSMLLHSDLP